MENSRLFLVFIIFNIFLGIDSLLFISSGIYSLIKVEYDKYMVIFIIIGVVMLTSFIFGFVGNTKKSILLVYIIIISIILLLEVVLAFLFEFGDENEFLEKIIEFTEQEEDYFKKELLIFLLVSLFFCVGSLIFGLAYYISGFDEENQAVDDAKKILRSSYISKNSNQDLETN